MYGKIRLNGLKNSSLQHFSFEKPGAKRVEEVRQFSSFFHSNTPLWTRRVILFKREFWFWRCGRARESLWTLDRFGRRETLKSKSMRLSIFQWAAGKADNASIADWNVKRVSSVLKFSKSWHLLGPAQSTPHRDGSTTVVCRSQRGIYSLAIMACGNVSGSTR